ncbi:MAG: hypothetical protein GWP08_20240 [Nitrospiraceae bacterium]|nr:hypothetical protein [Nitrospiraceae bacterium]
MLRYIAAVLIAGCSAVAYAGFSFEDDGKSLTLLEGGNKVFVYHYEPVDPPEGVKERYRRACYVHPLYGLDGDVLTEDFPADHYHHRGVFWGWPEARVGDRVANVWTCVDIYQHHEAWVKKEAGSDQAVLSVRNFWSFNDAPDTAVVREEVSYTVAPADELGRTIDIYARFTNVTEGEVTFQGSTAAISRKDKTPKGYGGFNIRPDSNRKPFTFTTIDGVCKQDKLRYETPWADIASQALNNGPVSGLAVFQDPRNPGYPHPGWIFRHYGFLGACWPHVEPHVLQAGESFELRYRLYIHRGTAEEGGVAEAFEKYVGETK